MPQNIELKQRQFNDAMNLYSSRQRYSLTGGIVSFINIAYQPLMLTYAFMAPMSISSHLAVLAVSFFAADLVNGAVHMILDNSSAYTSFGGPFIAAFHLHHRTPRYRKKNVFLVYLHEAGFKIWLALYSIASLMAVLFFDVPRPLVYGMAYFSILSCLAEVSHYCCHIPDPPVPRIFRTLRILLPKKYHMRYHFTDNCRYSFLNGMSDPLLNLYARLFLKGYKTTTDLHYALYTGDDTDNRGDE